MVFIYQLIMLNTKEHGKMIYRMDMVIKTGLMVLNIKVII